MPNLVSKLFEAANKAGNRPALMIGNGRKSESIAYSEFLLRVSDRAEALSQAGVGDGNRVLLFAPLSIVLFKYILALFWIGAAAVFADDWSDRKRLAAAVKVTQPHAFAGSWKAQFLRILSSEIRRIPRKMWVGTIPKGGGKSVPKAVPPDQAALITFTTGSTGNPKAALRTHDFLLHQHEVLGRHLGTTSSEVAWTTLPVFVLHFLGAGCTCVLPSNAGGDPDKLNIAEALNQMREQAVSTIITSPSVLSRLSDAVTISKSDIMISKIFVGGAPVYANDAKKYALAFPSAKITILYGSTEAEPISAIDLGEFIALDTQVEGLPVGQPVEGIRVKIIPLEFGDSSTGEICVAGRHVLKAYYNSPEEFAKNKFQEDGEIWHRTGDAGFLDANGILILMGRAGHRFETGGKLNYPIAIEKKLRAIPECARWNRNFFCQ